MATFQDMARDNPNIRAQYDDWRTQRAANNEDAVDWEAFRQHVMAIGAPDPGSRPPDDFVGEDFKQANPEWTRRWLAQASPEQASRLQAMLRLSECCLSRLKASRRVSARFSAPWRLVTRFLSSANVTSMSQCKPFSIPQ